MPMVTSQMLSTAATLGSFHMFYEENSLEDSPGSASNVSKGPPALDQQPQQTLFPLPQSPLQAQARSKNILWEIRVAFLPTGKGSRHD